METQARELMERQSERLDQYPEVKAKVTAHLQETNEQLKRLEQRLDALGEETSTLKDAAQSVMANMMAMTHAIAGDEILKNTFASQLVRTTHGHIFRLRSGKRSRWPSGSMPMLRK
jgi:ferritin-like metal-binding protein YciE